MNEYWSQERNAWHHTCMRCHEDFYDNISSPHHFCQACKPIPNPIFKQTIKACKARRVDVV